MSQSTHIGFAYRNLSDEGQRIARFPHVLPKSERQYVYVYMFCSVELRHSVSPMPANPTREGRSRLFWLHEIIFIDHAGYHSVDIRNGEHSSRTGRFTSIPTAFGTDNRIGIEHYFCVSRVRFTQARIDGLLRELAGESGTPARLTKINVMDEDETPPYSVSQGGDSTAIRLVILTDHLYVAQWLRSEFVASHDSFLDWATDDTRMLKRNMSDIMRQLREADRRLDAQLKVVRREDARSLHQASIHLVDRWRREDSAIGEERFHESLRRNGALAEHLQSEGFLATLEDYGEEELQEEGEFELVRCIAAMETHEPGRVALVRIMGNSNHWATKFVLNTTRAATDITWALLEPFTVAAVANGGEHRNNFIGVIVETVNRRRPGVDLRIAQGAVRRLDSNPSAGIIPNGLNVIITLINLYFHTNGNFRNIDARSAVDLARGISDFMDMLSNAYTAIHNAPRASGLNRAAVLRGAGRVVGIAASVASIIIGASDIMEASRRNDTGAAVGHWVGLAGSLAGVISSGLVIAGVAMAASKVLLVAGVILLIGSWLIVRFFGSNDLETWFLNCYWGRRENSQRHWNDRARRLGMSPPSGDTAMLRLQIADLQQIIYRFDTDITNSNTTPSSASFTIAVSMNAWIEGHSKLYLYVWKESRPRFLPSTSRLLFNENINSRLTSPLSPSRDSRVRRSFMILDGVQARAKPRVVRVPDLMQSMDKSRTRVFCFVFLDVFGDRTALVPYYGRLGHTRVGQWLSLPDHINRERIRL